MKKSALFIGAFIAAVLVSFALPLSYTRVCAATKSVKITVAEKKITSNSKKGISIKNGTTSASVDIKKSGTYVITGTGTNTKITINKSNKKVKKVTLILDNLSITNTELADDSPVIYIGKNTKGVDIKLTGASTLSGPATFTTAPAKGIIYDAGTGYVRFSLYTTDDTPSLTITDGMTTETDYGSKNPSAGIYAAGKIVIKKGTYSVTSNGSGLQAKKTGVAISGGDVTIVSNLKKAIATNNGNVNISGGNITVTGTKEDGFYAPAGMVKLSAGTHSLTGIGGDGIQAKTVLVSGGNTTITTTYEYGATDFYDEGMGAARHNTRASTTEKNVTTTTEYINYNTGSHAGILAGSEGYTYSIKTGGSGSKNAGGGIFITGGKLTIDTLATGTMSNRLTNTSYVAAETGLYIIGAPAPGIKSYNVMGITGGVHSISSAGNALEAEGAMTITKDTDILIPQAYCGLEAPLITIGTKDMVNDTTQVKMYTASDGIHGYSTVKKYVFEDSSLEKYKKVSESTTTNEIEIYSGYVNVMIDNEKTITGKGAGVLEKTNPGTGTSSSASGAQSFTPDGYGIYCAGDISFLGGTTVIYGMSTGSKTPFYTLGGKIKLGSGAEVLGMGVSSGAKNALPSSAAQSYLSAKIPSANASATTGTNSGTTTTTAKTEPGLKSGDAVGLLNSSDKTLIGIKMPKSADYIFYSSGKVKGTYSLCVGGDLSGAVNTYTYDGRYQTYTRKTSGTGNNNNTGTDKTDTTAADVRTTITAKK